MKALCTFFLTLFSATAIAQFCNSSGNVIVYANYDGGQLTINVDEDIPNLKIGVCSYEACSVVITGAFASNVSEVLYAGFEGDNDHCGLGIVESTITAPAGVQTNVLFAPPGVLTDANGYGSIICGYSCGTEYQGGCNTAEQIVAYFLNQFGGTLYYYFTQYGCWPAGSLAIGPGGNCCPGVQPLPPSAVIEVSETQVCAGECITVADASSGEPTTWSWQFAGTTGPASAQNPGTICYNQPGSYSITLTASNAQGSSTVSTTIDVVACDVPGCMYPQAVNYNPAATVDDLSCQFPCSGSDCPADLDDNGVIGVSDLLLFIGLFGSTCPN